MPPATLFLIPTPLSETAGLEAITPKILRVVRELSTFVVENAKTARATLKHYQHPQPLAELQLITLDEHSDTQALQQAIAPLLSGQDVGLMSEAGCPGIADPGAQLVRLAHQHGLRVAPLVGPSSPLLALMASGLEGQRFAFHGYLPVQRDARVAALRTLEQRAYVEQATQLFIETPYRNAVMLEAIIQACRPETLLCVAADLSGEQESISTRSVANWRLEPPLLQRVPMVFLLGAPTQAPTRLRGSGRQSQ